MADKGPLSKLIARRFYASVLNDSVAETSGITAWFNFVIETIESSLPLLKSLEASDIDGILWIAVFGPELIAAPTINNDLINQARRLNLQILIENYTDMRDGSPNNDWILKTEH